MLWCGEADAGNSHTSLSALRSAVLAERALQTEDRAACNWPAQSPHPIHTLSLSLSPSVSLSLSLFLCIDWRRVSSNPCRAVWGEEPIACQGGPSWVLLASSRQRCCIWNLSTVLTVTTVTQSPRRRLPSHPRLSSRTLQQHLLPWIRTAPRDPRPLTS